MQSNTSVFFKLCPYLIADGHGQRGLIGKIELTDQTLGEIVRGKK